MEVSDIKSIRIETAGTTKLEGPIHHKVADRILITVEHTVGPDVWLLGIVMAWFVYLGLR